MGWSEIGGGEEGGFPSSANYTVKALTGIPSGNVQIKDGTGNILSSLALDEKGKASYVRQLTTDNIGQQKLGAHFTGDHQFQSKSGDAFTSHIADKNGNNATASQLQAVNKIVAGPGIYISSPNGQGVVTISTSPIPIKVTTEQIHDIFWSVNTGSNIAADGGYIPGQFTAVGENGVNLRSRDGYNWVQLPHSSTRIIGISAEIDLSLPDYHLEYNGVTLDGKSVYGRLGWYGNSTATNEESVDGMSSITQLSDQNGPITENLYSTFIFVQPPSTAVGFPWAHITSGQNSSISMTVMNAGDQLYFYGTYPGNINTYGTSIGIEIFGGNYPTGNGGDSDYFYDVDSNNKTFGGDCGYNYPPGDYTLTIRVYANNQYSQPTTIINTYVSAVSWTLV